ncbi:DMT family transporter [Mesorhizobium sp. CA8]|uniref:DMT family transporter n=1 Tax=unclassified Mesorhizobium TaxID=325217 RepID=UPI001CCA3FC5|nr:MULTISPECIES: DMT family transporter [unclassified Mesorhizobium]MBZ9761658.1 DMT family transporter [Mesorhizobium sp. CA8]MBZ9820588.1 DMT family transporter [Mesorhizobium sp. CA4]
MNRNTLLGISCLCIGIFSFSMQDAVLKGLSGRLPVTEAMTVRAMLGLPILGLIVHWTVGLRSIFHPVRKILIVRGSLSFSAFICYYLAFPALPLAGAIGLYYTAPLIILILSSLFLGEKLNSVNLASTAIGLAGVAVMLRPSTGVFEPAALLSLLSALLYGISQILARRLGGALSAPTMAFYQHTVFALGAPFLAYIIGNVDWSAVTHPSILFLVRPWVWNPYEIGAMLLCGLFAVTGTLLLTQAYRVAPASTVTIFEYTGLIWAPTWGALFYHEIPSAGTILGLVMIAAAGLLSVLGPSWLLLVPLPQKPSPCRDCLEDKAGSQVSRSGPSSSVRSLRSSMDAPPTSEGPKQNPKSHACPEYSPERHLRAKPSRGSW